MKHLQAPPVSTGGVKIVFLVSGIGLAVCAVLFWDSVVAMVDIWYRSATFNHGFTIFPISAYLIWEKRHALGDLRPRPTAWGIPLLVGCSLFWLVGRVTGTMAIQQFGMIFILQSFVFTLLGWDLTRRILFPLLFLLFAVPFGEFLVPRLQDFTAAAVVIGLQIVGIPVFIDGVFLTTPTGHFEVAEACSGLRFLIAMVALGVLATQFFYNSWWRKLVFIVLAIAIPVFANGARAFGIVMLAHLSNNEIATGVDHIVYGWIFFSLVMLVVLGIGMLFRDRTLGDDLGTAPPAGGDTGAGAVRMTAATLIAVVTVSLAPAYAFYSESMLAGRTVGKLAPPVPNAPWIHVQHAETDWQPNFPNTDAALLTRFTAAGKSVDLYIAYYAYQRDDFEVVNTTNRVADGEDWKRISSGRVSTTIDGQTVTVLQTRMRSAGGERLVWRWHWVDGAFVSDAKIAKLRQARAALLGGRPEAATVAISASYIDKPEEASSVLRDFLERHPTIHEVLAAAQQ